MLLHLYIYVNRIHKQNADSTNSLRIPPTICGFRLNFAESTTAHFNYKHALFFVCGLHKLIRIPQILFRIPQICQFIVRF